MKINLNGTRGKLIIFLMNSFLIGSTTYFGMYTFIAENFIAFYFYTSFFFLGLLSVLIHFYFLFGGEVVQVEQSSGGKE